MVQTCFIVGCLSRCDGKEKKSFFQFPSDKSECQNWQDAILFSNHQSCENITKYSKVCEKHFRTEDIIRTGLRCVLSKGAKPTIFLKAAVRESNVDVDFMDVEYLDCEGDPSIDSLSEIQCLHPPAEQTDDLNTFDVDIVMVPESSQLKLPPEQKNVGRSDFICQNCGYYNCNPISNSDVHEVYVTSAWANDQSSVSDNSSTPSQSETFGSSRKSISNSKLFCSSSNAKPKLTECTSSQHSRSVDNRVYVEDITENENPFDSPKRGAKRRLCYPGDVTENENLSPTSSKKFISNLKKTITKQRVKLSNLQQRNRRAFKRISTLKSLVKDLRQKNLVSENALESLKLHDESLMRKITVGKVNNQFPADVRSFALTLNFYSPRAYRYVRKKFASKLPAPRTIRKWYESVDADPGITEEALNALTLRIEDSRKKGVDLRFCMSIDDVNIRKQIEYCKSKKRFYGYVDFGGVDIDRENTTPATKALMMMLTAINGHFKIPVAYFLTNGLTSEEQANAVDMVLRTLCERSVAVVALVFDGAATNISMINVLNRNGKDAIFFHHPVTKERIYIIWDICHMLKLVRNTLEDKKILHDAQGRAIEWRYIEMLHDLQDLNRIRLGNKLTKQHVQFHGKKMNVRLAAQTLSRSVADALDVLKEKNAAFKDCGATIEFIRVFDRLFDICNSKSKYGKYFKRPIQSDSESEVFEFFATATKYIEGITLYKKKIITTKSYTGFFGFIQTMSSIRQLYNENVKNGPMDYLLTYKLSQDHIETFFGCIRSRGGFNNNPNAIQLRSAYKQLIIHNEITCPSQANCINGDNTNILTVSASRSKILHVDEDVDCGSSILSKDYKQMVVSHGMNDIVSESVVYIAGFVERSIRRKLNCQACLEALDGRRQASGALLTKKDYGQFGGLCHPVMEVVVLCRIAERNLQIIEKENRLNEAQMYLRILNKCLRDVPTKLLDNMTDHIKECDPLENHRYFLIKAIIEEYMQVKLFYYGKLHTIELHKKFVRAKNTKVTLFAGQ